VADVREISFGGQPLHAALAAALAEPVSRWEDFSGGVWRQHMYAGARQWPAVCAAFERVKYRCTLAGGNQVLFKFLGLAALSPALRSTADEAAELLVQRAARQLAPPVLASALGFVATEWVAGAPLAASASLLDFASTIGSYIARVAGPSLAGAEREEASARLCEMLYANTHEALGDEAAKRARNLGRAVQDGGGSYGDGHLHPHEWIDCGDGRLVKVDGVGHDCDHTLVGRQPVAWDLAGAVVEWSMDQQRAERLLAGFRLAGGEDVAEDVLRFYLGAYLAFRAGQCALAAQVHDPYERERLWEAYARYRQELAVLLSEP
jgi:hypothetical protein